MPSPRASRPRVPFNQHLFGAGGRISKMKVPKGKPVASGMKYGDFLLEKIPKESHAGAHARLMDLNSVHPTKRSNAIQTLVRLYGAGASRVVKEVLSHDAPAVQLEALRAVQESWSKTMNNWHKDVSGNHSRIEAYRKELMPSLIRLIRSPELSIQQNAIRLINMLGPTPTALGALRRFQRDMRAKARGAGYPEWTDYHNLGVDAFRIRHQTIHSLRRSRQDARRERAATERRKKAGAI